MAYISSIGDGQERTANTTPAGSRTSADTREGASSLRPEPNSNHPVAHPSETQALDLEWLKGLAAEVAAIGLKLASTADDALTPHQIAKRGSDICKVLEARFRSDAEVLSKGADAITNLLSRLAQVEGERDEARQRALDLHDEAFERWSKAEARAQAAEASNARLREALHAVLRVRVNKNADSVWCAANRCKEIARSALTSQDEQS